MLWPTDGTTAAVSPGVPHVPSGFGPENPQFLLKAMGWEGHQVQLPHITSEAIRVHGRVVATALQLHDGRQAAHRHLLDGEGHVRSRNVTRHLAKMSVPKRTTPRTLHPTLVLTGRVGVSQLSEET